MRNHTAWITIDREEQGNRLTPASLAHLRDTATALAKDARTSCVVISGAGAAHFSAGIFNIQLRAAYSKEDALDIVRLANDAFDAIEALPQVVVGALNGTVRAGGGELALACDFRVCAHHATMAFHETSYACFPGAGAPVRLPAVVGAGRAVELMATGREIDADEMLRMGLVSHVLPADTFRASVAAMAEKIASQGPLGIRGAKRVAQASVLQGPNAAHRLSWDLRRALEYSSDVDEAIAAHVEQRTAHYLGR
ncbi:enoyl-CoA hydratase/isomerase family protein [Hydrogenophaga sp. BPS33]|uniref:enoyl-CoA hydratase/isomerase family protein n=1 Tax=Hydrogenophaga sp. BPS33 TaxID=2651974 RepID=UPI001F320E2B|nr:enoyl-CoA hydratase-related protein [Hydrogenophaga sp. BPS33]